MTSESLSLNYKKNKKHFREIEHTADVGLEISGNSLPQLFANAAFGFYNLLVGDLNVPVNHAEEIVIRDLVLNDLIVSWLSELNYHFTVDHFVMSKIEALTITKKNSHFDLYTRLSGNLDSSYPLQAQFEIKAVTYHQLRINKTKSGFRTRIYFDI